MNKGRVLDASAVLAVLFMESGFKSVIPALESGSAIIGSVNYAEVLSRLGSYGAPPKEAIEAVAALGVQVIPFGRGQAEFTAQIHPDTSKHGLSMGDRACLALGKETGFPVLTADKAWGKLHIEGVKVELLR